MTCPICDQKPMNCDCTPRERAMWREMQERGDAPTAILTADERLAIEAAVRIIDFYEDEMDGFASGAAATLRGLLERAK